MLPTYTKNFDLYGKTFYELAWRVRCSDHASIERADRGLFHFSFMLRGRTEHWDFDIATGRVRKQTIIWIIKNGTHTGRLGKYTNWYLVIPKKMFHYIDEENKAIGYKRKGYFTKAGTIRKK